MKISYNWLKDFINLELSPKDTAEKLTLIGLEVEDIAEYGSLLKGVIVGEVIEVKEHPNADRLRICMVNLGDQKAQIICGAQNVAGGQKVPVATVGTTLPITLDDGSKLTIKKAKLRGEESRGMICAEDELGLGANHEGIMVLDEGLPVGTPISDVFELYQDTIFDIAITPNRPDATCHLGVARDLAAALNLKLEKPFESDPGKADPLKEVEIEIKNPDKCHRYVGMQIKDVSISESPAWLCNKLKAVGVRPINNVVDVTNYVMLELGQPLHAFDLNTITSNKIMVRDFDKEIEFETLDHVKRTCSAGTLFICDAETPVAIAGIMGGVDSEVSDSTTNLLLESAYFDPTQTRKTAKEQTLQTDASYRFERGIDPNLQRIAAYRAATLIVEIAGGNLVDGCTDVHPTKTEATELSLRSSYTNRLLGTDFNLDEIADLLNGLELNETGRDKQSITYTVPTFRPDLQREVDLIEEVGRLYDYNNIPAPQHGKFVAPESIGDWEELKQKAKETAKGLGYREIYSNSLIPDKDAQLLGNPNRMIHTLNPISTDMTTLRPSLLSGFLKSVSYNFNRNIKGVQLFEVGNVFNKSGTGTYYDGINEETHLLIGLAGYKTIEHWKTDAGVYDVFDAKASLQNFLTQFVSDSHIATSANIQSQLEYSINGQYIGLLHTLEESLLKQYDIDEPAFVAELSLTKLHKAMDGLASGYNPVSKFPSFEFDFAVIVDISTRAGDLMDQIKKTAPQTLQNLNIFDVFEGESLGKHKKSLAFRLSFIDKNKTLTINDVEPIIDKVITVLEERFSAKLRS